MNRTIKRIDYTWLSLHIHFSGDANALLRQAIAPFISSWKGYLSPDSPWFFIRYWEGGSHIRLRFNVNPAHHKSITESLDNDFLQFSSTSFKIEKVLIANYNPEVNRYGNGKSIAWAERYFATSSSYILNWLLKMNGHKQPTSQAIQLHLVLLYHSGLKLCKIIILCDFFINGWLPRLYRKGFPMEQEKEYWLNQFEQIFLPKKEMICLAASSFWASIAGDILNEELTQYSISCREIMDIYHAEAFSEFKFQEIISSLMHMTNNRLGIGNQEEAYLLYVVKNCMISIAQADQSN